MTPTLEPYPKMKDSSIDWLDEMPSHWEACRVCHRMTPRKRPVDPDEISEEQIFHYSIPNVQRFGGGGIESGSSIDSTKILVDRTLLLVSKLNPRKSSIALAMPDQQLTTLASGEFVALEPRDCLGSFAQYLYESEPVRQDLSSRVASATKSHQRCSPEDIIKLRAPFPPLPEQTAIARFLDQMDHRIQKYIRAKEKLIALLDEYKQALIHQAVTGQIDVRTGKPYGDYKESGVEWLGRIPGHWETCRLRTVMTEVTTGSRGWSSFAADQGPLFLRIANLSRGSLRLRFDDVVRLKLPDTSEAIRTRVEPGDILLSVTAYIGSVGIASSELGEAYVSQHVARCKPKSGALPLWLGYVLLSKLGQTHGQLSLYGGTKDGLSLDDVKNYPILLPPMQEQRDIVRWVERKINLATKATEHANAQLERVREYRAPPNRRCRDRQARRSRSDERAAGTRFTCGRTAGGVA